MDISRRNLFALAAATAVVGPGCGLIDTVRDAKVVGIVSQLARHGVFNPTWEGEIALSNLRNRGASGGSSTFHFHVDNDQVLKKLQDAMANVTPIEVSYTETWGHNPFTRENDAVVTDVKDLTATLTTSSNPNMARAEKLGSDAAGDNGPSGDNVRGNLLLSCKVVPAGKAP